MRIHYFNNPETFTVGQLWDYETILNARCRCLFRRWMQLGIILSWDLEDLLAPGTLI